MSERLYDLGEACEYLGISKTTLWRLVTGGVLKIHKIGRQVRISESDLASYLEGARRVADRPTTAKV